jgi:hypothetical protein
MPDFEEPALKEKIDLKVSVDESLPFVPVPNKPSSYREWRKGQRNGSASKFAPRMILKLLAGALLLGGGFGALNDQCTLAWKCHALKDHGQMASATLTAKDHYKCGDHLCPRFRFDFHDQKGASFSAVRSITDREFDETPLGTKMELRYLPEDPLQSEWPDQIVHLPWFFEAILWIVPALLSLGGLGLIAGALRAVQKPVVINNRLSTADVAEEKRAE